MISSSELITFYDDPDGFYRYSDYIEKIIDNLYQFSKFQYDKRVSLAMASKLSRRRKLHKKLLKVMPMYCEQLKKWEKSMMKKYRIRKSLIK